MKRFFAMLLSLVLVFSMFACGGSEVNTDTSGTDTSSNVISATQSDSDTSSVASSESTDTSTDSQNASSSAVASSDVTTDASNDSQTSSNVATDTSTDSVSSEQPPASTSTNASGGTADTPPEDEVKAPTVEELATGHFLALTDQLNDQIAVIDLDAEYPASDDAIVWQWSIYDHRDIPSAQKLSGSRLDDVKIRVCDAWGGAVVGVTSSSGLVALLEYPSGKCLFSADMSGYGPHSIEILPNGLIAVAASGNGNNDKSVLRIYSATSKTDTKFVEVSIVSTHGVMWDPQKEALWVLGNTVLQLYTVGGTRENPTLTLKSSADVKFSGGHDLSPVYGNPDLMWVTYSKVAQYSKSKGTFSFDYEANADINVNAVKSINTYADGTIAMTVADSKNTTATHDTDKIRVFRYVEENGTKTYKCTEIWFDVFDGDHCDTERDFYKVRAFVPAYQ